MEAEDEIFLVGCNLAALDGGAEVVHPSEAAALAAAEEAGSLREGAPPALALPCDVIGKELVLFRRPRPPLQTHLGAAWRRLAGSHGRSLRWVPHLFLLLSSSFFSFSFSFRLSRNLRFLCFFFLFFQIYWIYLRVLNTNVK